MMDCKDLRKIGEEIGRKISKCSNIKAVAFIGSIAYGFADEYSKDVDIICYCNTLPSIKERRKYLGEQNYEKTGLISDHMEIFKIDGTNIDITFFIPEIYEWGLKMNPNDEGAEKHVLFKIQICEPIVDKNDFLIKLKEKIKYTDDYQIKKIERQFSVLCNSKEVNKKPLIRNDTAFLDYRFSFLVEKYASLIFALNKRYFSDLKWIEKHIEKFNIKPKNTVRNIRKMSEMGNKSCEIEEKMKILKNMIFEISEVIKKEVPKAKIDESIKKIRKW